MRAMRAFLSTALACVVLIGVAVVMSPIAFLCLVSPRLDRMWFGNTDGD